MSLIREGTHFTRSIVAIVLTTFLALILSPTVAAAREVIADPTKLLGKPAPIVEQDKLNDALKQVKATLQRMDLAAQKGSIPAADFKALAALKSELIAADKDVTAGFASDLAHIKKHKLPEVIQQRHVAAVADYQAKHKQMLVHLDAVAAAKDTVSRKARVADTQVWLGEQKIGHSYQPFDPHNLPVGVPKPEIRRPKLTAKELKSLLLPAPGRGVTGASAGDIFPADRGIAFADIAPVQVASTALTAGLIAVAAVTPPGPEYLAPTEDAQITQAIRDLAAQLHNHPVQIYNWVRNNIEFIPSYGSIQGSDMTLQTKRGNAFDTASLLIALLRASNVPARYVYGTVQIPSDQIMNWVGGVTVPEAAGNLLAQGGIPSLGLTQGGKVVAYRLEHVWVEAFVDLYPSKGAKNFVPDSWAPMDASFKQYAYTQGMNLQQAVPFDAQAFTTQIQQTSTVNMQQGWVSGVDQAYVQSQLTQYEQQVREFVETQNPEATLGQILGSKTIQPIQHPYLPASLPYKLVAEGNKLATLPDSVRYQFTYQLQDSYGEEVFTFTASTPSVAGKRLALSFRPSTQKDQDTIASYVPQPHEDGSPAQPEEYPQSLPGYLIKLTPEFNVDGQVVASGGSFTMGTELKTQKGYVVPGRGEQFRNKVLVAGEYHAVGIDLQGISPKQLDDLKAGLEQTKSKLETASFDGLTKHSLTGALLQAGVVGYFAVNDADTIIQRSFKVVDYRLPSFGTFQTDLNAIYSYGAPRIVKFPGVLMDIDQVYSSVETVTADSAAEISYVRARGSRLSAFEHLVPEQLFDDPATTALDVEGISAVKALGVAANQGQRIYTVTQGNVAQVLPNLDLSADLETEIANATNAGLQVIVHQASISYAGFNGAGYIIVDPETGAGAYKISGGANGALLYLLYFLQGLALLGSLVLLIGALYAAVAFGVLLAVPTHSHAALHALLTLVPLLGALSAMTFAVATGSNQACRTAIGLAVSGGIGFVVTLAIGLVGEQAVVALLAIAGISIAVEGANILAEMLHLLSFPEEACEDFEN